MCVNKLLRDALDSNILVMLMFKLAEKVNISNAAALQGNRTNVLSLSFT